MVAHRKYDHEDIIRRLQSGERPVDIARDLGCGNATITRVIKKARDRGDLPPHEEKYGIPSMGRMGVRMGPVRKEMHERLTREEWGWILNRINRKNTTISDVIIELVRETAAVDEREGT